MIVFWTLLLLAVIAAAGWVALLFAMGRGRLFDPRSPRLLLHSTWDQFEIPILAGAAWIASQETEHQTLESFDGLTLHARLLPAAGPARGTILLFHGYRSIAAVDFSATAKALHDEGFHLLLVDQRAHGHSQGRWITYGVNERQDCTAWAWHCYRRFGPNHPLFLYGMSMGATTVLLAAGLGLPRTVQGILADCGFTAPVAILRHVLSRFCRPLSAPLLWLLRWYARWLLHVDLDCCSTPAALHRTRLPVLLLHGVDDSFVPMDMSREAAAACGGYHQLYLVTNAGHGGAGWVDRNGYLSAVKGFLHNFLHDIP